MANTRYNHSDYGWRELCAQRHYWFPSNPCKDCLVEIEGKCPKEVKNGDTGNSGGVGSGGGDIKGDSG